MRKITFTFIAIYIVFFTLSCAVDIEENIEENNNQDTNQTWQAVKYNSP